MNTPRATFGAFICDDPPFAQPRRSRAPNPAPSDGPISLPSWIFMELHGESPVALCYIGARPSTRPSSRSI